MSIWRTSSTGELFLRLARVVLQFSRAPGADKLLEEMPNWRLTPSQWKDQAVRFLELGRSRTLLDLLIAEKLAPRSALRDWSEYSYQLRGQGSSELGRKVQRS